jgi:hypothetical protein
MWARRTDRAHPGQSPGRLATRRADAGGQPRSNHGEGCTRGRRRRAADRNAAAEKAWEEGCTTGAGERAQLRHRAAAPAAAARITGSSSGSSCSRSSIPLLRAAMKPGITGAAAPPRSTLASLLAPARTASLLRPSPRPRCGWRRELAAHASGRAATRRDCADPDISRTPCWRRRPLDRMFAKSSEPSASPDASDRPPRQLAIPGR